MIVVNQIAIVVTQTGIGRTVTDARTGIAAMVIAAMTEIAVTTGIAVTTEIDATTGIAVTTEIDAMTEIVAMTETAEMSDAITGRNVITVMDLIVLPFVAMNHEIVGRFDSLGSE